MTSATLEELQIQVANAACPNCDRLRLELRIRCDFGQDECLCVVHCAGCDQLYEVDARTVALAQDRPYVEDLLRALLCPKCKSGKVELGFACDLSTRECSYRTTCRTCGAVV